MKANAPEKIYIHPDIGGREFLRPWLHRAANDESVEYVRKDAFVEKALDYIENNIYDHYDGDHEYGICGGYVKKEEFIENFKNYIRG